MRRLIWPLLPVLSLLWSCASDDTPVVEGGEVVYAEDGSGTTLAAHTGSSVAYGDDGAVGSAGPGGDGGSGATPVQGTTTYTSGPGTAMPSTSTAVVAQPAFYWYKPWTWKYRQSPARPAWRPSAPVAPRPVVVPAPYVPAPRPYVPAPVYVPAPRPVYVPAPRPYVPAPRPVYVPVPVPGG